MKYKILFPAFLLFISLSAFNQTTASADTLSDGNEVIFTRAEINPSFPGGEKAWTKYIRAVIEKNIDSLIDDNKSGTCRVKFIVDKEGNVSNTEALTMKGSVLAGIVVDAIANGPKWKPAQQNGRVVKAFKKQPVTFTLKESR
jgi:protein TonB